MKSLLEYKNLIMSTGLIPAIVCMIMAVYSGHKMISGSKRTRKQVEKTKAEE